MKNCNHRKDIQPVNTVIIMPLPVFLMNQPLRLIVSSQKKVYCQ